MEEQKMTTELARKYWEDNEKYTITPRELSSNSEEDVIPEIKDIYDQIYGIVQTKRVFYEGKKTDDKDKPRHATAKRGDSCSSEEAGDRREGDLESAASSSQVIESADPDLLKECEDAHGSCPTADFSSDRCEVLAEMNASLRLELDNAKRDLKREVAKNTELNYEIANIESTLEAYYKEAKHQRSALGSLYSAIKNYGANRQHYAYVRIVMIANYIESLKDKLAYQDMVIKSNFVENPYSTDLVIKHEEMRKQLDNLSTANEELKQEIKRKETEELETIKELNRQKFQIETKFRETVEDYKREINTKDDLIRQIKEEHDEQLKKHESILEEKDKQMTELENVFQAKIENYKQEILIVYRKWKDIKALSKKDNGGSG